MRGANRKTFYSAIVMMIWLTGLTCSQAHAQPFGRSWTCDATIFATGTSQQYTPPPWKMATGDPHSVFGDREKSCKKYIENTFLNGGIWSKFNFTAAEQDKICRSGNTTFRIEYGFDKRPKSFQFTKDLPAPACNCDVKCANGYDLDNNSSPGNPRCVRKLCDTAAGLPDQRLGPHENGIGISHGGIYHHQPVIKGPCKFK